MDTWPDSDLVGSEDDMADDVVEFTGVYVKKETTLAVLCCIDGKDHWIPKSQIDDESEVYDRSHDGCGPGKLIVTQWIAEERGLV